MKGCECSHFVIGITQQHLRHQDCLVGAVRESANDRWQIAGIKSDGSFVGTPVAELEHPWD